MIEFDLFPDSNHFVYVMETCDVLLYNEVKRTGSNINV